MNLLNWIEQRVALPEDSETFRSQKVLATLVLIISSVATTINGVRLYVVGGLAEVMVIYLLLAAMMLVGFVLAINRPHYYRPMALIILFASMISSLPAHYYSGGYTSGILLIQWAILTLILTVLFVGIRPVIFFTGLYVAIIVAAGLIEPQARSNMPVLDPSFVSQEATFTMLMMGFMVVGAVFYLFNQIERYRKRADDLLLNILPGAIAGRLKESPGTIADGYNEVTVLFADIVDFTRLSSGADPVAVVNKLNEIFTDFDVLAAKHGLEKIKTIGDAYMVAAGLPEPRADHCQAVAAFAVDMLDVMAKHASWQGDPMHLRVGINTGSVVAGVIGQQKFIYDLWGDAVNVASRMESNGLSDQIQVTRAVKDCLDGHYSFEQRAPIQVKGKGEMVTYLLRPL